MTGEGIPSGLLAMTRLLPRAELLPKWRNARFTKFTQKKLKKAFKIE
jgi:hypothetical protein